MATAPANPDATATITINSQDRFPTFDSSRNPALTTLSNDITFTLPGLRNFKKIQLVYGSIRGSTLGYLNTPGLNCNVINASYNGGSPQLITLPFDLLMITTQVVALQNTVQVLQNILRQTFNDQSISIGQQGVAANLFAGLFAWQGITTAVGTSYPLLAWKSTSATLSFSRVQNYKGVDISNERQLFDMLGMPFTISNGVPTSATSPINTYAGTIYPFVTGGAFTNYIDLVSPDLISSPGDVSSVPSYPSQYGMLVARFASTYSVNNAFGAVSALPGSYLKTITPKNGNTLRLIMLNDQGKPIPPVRIPALQPILNSTGAFTGTGSVGTLTWTSFNPSTYLSPGQKVVIGTTVFSSPLNLLVTLSTVTVTTVTFPTTYTTSTPSVSISGPYNEEGNINGGGLPEYNLMFVGVPYADLMS
jgi:hypothetical protein